MKQSVKDKIKSVKDYLLHGEILAEATAHNIERGRAYDIASGRISPRPQEFGFINGLVSKALPRKRELERINYLHAS